MQKNRTKILVIREINMFKSYITGSSFNRMWAVTSCTDCRRLQVFLPLSVNGSCRHYLLHATFCMSWSMTKKNKKTNLSNKRNPCTLCNLQTWPWMADPTLCWVVWCCVAAPACLLFCPEHPHQKHWGSWGLGTSASLPWSPSPKDGCF